MRPDSPGPQSRLTGPIQRSNQNRRSGAVWHALDHATFNAPEKSMPTEGANSEGSMSAWGMNPCVARSTASRDSSRAERSVRRARQTRQKPPAHAMNAAGGRACGPMVRSARKNPATSRRDRVAKARPTRPSDPNFPLNSPTARRCCGGWRPARTAPIIHHERDHAASAAVSPIVSRPASSTPSSSPSPASNAASRVNVTGAREAVAGKVAVDAMIPKPWMIRPVQTDAE